MDLHEIVSRLKLLAVELGKTPTLREFEASGVSKRQIQKHGFNNLVRMAGLEVNRGLNGEQHKEVVFKKPKILILDIETAPMLVRSYGLWNQNISTGFIVKDWYMLSFAAKWAGDKKFYYKDTRDTHEDDSEVAKFAWNLMNQADVIVGHNSDRFDLKKLNTRFLKHGLKPLGKKRTVDTLKIAKKYFAVSSNKLDYIAKFLGIEGKRKSPKYSQQEMWNLCCEGVKDAFKENEKYNKQDIVVTENVFDVLKTWDESLNLQAFYGEFVCTCGGTKFVKDGFNRTKNTVKQRYRCVDCGKSSVGRENLVDKEMRKGFMS